MRVIQLQAKLIKLIRVIQFLKEVRFILKVVESRRVTPIKSQSC